MILWNSDGERSNFTLSDDDEAFQECQSSLTDLSGVKNDEDEGNKTLEVEVASPGSGNETLTVGSDVTFNKTQTRVNATFDGDVTKEKVSDKTVDLSGGSKNEFELPEVIDEYQEKSESVDAAAKTEALDAPKDDEIKSPEQKETPEVPEIIKSPENSNKILEVSENPQENPIINNGEEELEIFVAVHNTAEHHVPEKDSSALPEIELNVSAAQSSSPNISQEAAESTLPDSPAPEAIENGDVSMEDVSADRQDVASSFPTEIKIPAQPEPKEVHEKSPEPEIVYRNIDESGKWDKIEANDQQGTASPKLSPMPEKVFTETMGSSFDVQFKMPAAVFFKPQLETQPPQHVTDADFGCGGSCKIHSSIWKTLTGEGNFQIFQTFLRVCVFRSQSIIPQFSMFSFDSDVRNFVYNFSNLHYVFGCVGENTIVCITHQFVYLLKREKF